MKLFTTLSIMWESTSETNFVPVKKTWMTAKKRFHGLFWFSRGEKTLKGRGCLFLLVFFPWYFLIHKKQSFLALKTKYSPVKKLLKPPGENNFFYWKIKENSNTWKQRLHLMKNTRINLRKWYKSLWNYQFLTRVILIFTRVTSSKSPREKFEYLFVKIWENVPVINILYHLKNLKTSKSHFDALLLFPREKTRVCC